MASLDDVVSDLKKSISFFKNHPLLSSSPLPPPASATPLDTPGRALFTYLQQHFPQLHQLLHNAPSAFTTPAVTGLIRKPRLDDPTYLTFLALFLAGLFVTMSWFSRTAPNPFGRFSPFGRGNQATNNEVSDNDFSYITKEDLEEHTGSHRRHRSSSRSAAPEIVDWDDKNPDRDTDILVFKVGRVSYPTHFPAQTIRDGDLKIGTVRQAAAKKLNVTDPRRIRMFFKGRQLKFDDRPAKEEGLRGDGTGSEILCVIGEQSSGAMAPGAEDMDSRISDRDYDRDDNGSEDDGEDAVSDNISPAAGKKKPRKRGGKKKKKAPGSASTPDLAYQNPTPAASEFLPIPSHIPAPRPTSAPPSQPAQQTGPQSPLQKLDTIASKFHTEMVPLCVSFINNPPEDKAKRAFEHKKLAETILAQVLLKLDGVETEGDPDARARRKEIVRETQNMLNKLDEVVK